MDLRIKELGTIGVTIIISVAAPVVTSCLAWMLFRANLLMLPSDLSPKIFTPIAVLLCISASPIFIFLFRKIKIPSYVFPIVGSVAPLPVSIIFVLAFGALADDSEMTMRVALLSAVAIIGFISGLAVSLLRNPCGITNAKMA